MSGRVMAVVAASVLALLCSLQPMRCEPMTVMEFLPDAIDDTSMLDAGAGALPDLWQVRAACPQLSYCTRFYLTRYSEGFTSFFSYHLNKFDTGIAYKGASVGTLRLQVESVGIISSNIDELKVERLRWHSLCASVDLSISPTQVTYVFNNQVFSVNVTTTGRSMEGGGRLVIGQELDDLAGGFNDKQSYHGRQADMWLLAKALSTEEMMKFTRDCVPFPEDDDSVMYNFGEKLSKFEVRETVRKFTVEREEICNEQNDFVLPSLGPITFSKALKVCKTMGSTLFYPKNRISEEAFFRQYYSYSKPCLGSFSTSFWYGIGADYQLQRWKSLDSNETIEYSNFRKGYDTMESPDTCVTVATLQDAWLGSNCNQTACAVCTVKSSFEIRVRGLCEKSSFESTLIPDSLINNEWSFSSPFYSRLAYDGSKWTLQNILDGSIMEMQKSSSQIPLGLSTWSSPSACETTELMLTITACREDIEWTCWNGDCINKSLRCDTSQDCEDESDEIDCFQFELPLGYNPQNFPPSKDDGTFTPTIFIRLINIKKLDLTSFSLSVDFKAYIWWSDPRIKMRFLGAAPQEVVITPSLWLPDFVLEDEFGSMVHVVEYDKKLSVEEKGHPLKNIPSHHSQDDFYKGSDITLLLISKLGATFSCSFDLKFYPFDVQTCAVILKMTNVPQISLREDEQVVMFDGQRHLLEYSLVKLNLSTRNHQFDMPHLKVELAFKNQYTYYIGNAFVPSLLVVLVCYYVFYFDLDDFQDRIMVSLTSLLVLVSLFSQTTEAIPKTSYIKLIDVWFMTCIAFDFCVISVVVFIECNRIKEAKTNKIRPQDIVSFAEQPVGMKDAQLMGKNPSQLHNQGLLPQIWLTELNEERKHEVPQEKKTKFSCPYLISIDGVSKWMFPAIYIIFIVIFTNFAVQNLS